MASFEFDDEEELAVEESSDHEDSEEEGFQQGYEKEEEVEECAECGVALSSEKKVVCEIAGEEYKFCSKTCAKEFEESLKKE